MYNLLPFEIQKNVINKIRTKICRITDGSSTKCRSVKLVVVLTSLFDLKTFEKIDIQGIEEFFPQILTSFMSSD